MGHRRFSKPQKTLLARTLVGAFAAVSASSAVAATNYLIATDAYDPLSWSEADTYSDGANVINIPGTWFVDDSNDSLDLGYGLYIGHAGTGSLAITVSPTASYSDLSIESDEFDPNMPPLIPNWDPSFRVGDAGGTGTLTIELQELPEDEWNETRLYTSNTGLGVGLGAGSSGLVTVLGTGKDSSQFKYQGPNEVLFVDSEQNFYIGQSGGQGTLTINGAGFTADLGHNYDDDLALNYFAVGEGAGAFGSVNILGKGKLAIGNPAWSDNISERADQLPLSFIGKDGGEGSVTIGVTLPLLSGVLND